MFQLFSDYNFYLFEDLYNGEKAIFDNKEALDKFMEGYGNYIYSLDNSFPVKDEEYSITTLTVINPDFKAWNEGEYDEKNE